MKPVPLVALMFLAGCLGNDAPSPEPPPAAPARAPPGPTWELLDCHNTLHVWLVPLDELRTRTPPDFPPAVLREQGLVDTPFGRVVFYLYDCGLTNRSGEHVGRSMLGLLGIRVDPPPEVAPPAEKPPWAVTPWVSVYLLHAVAFGPVQEALNASGVPWQPVGGGVTFNADVTPEFPAARALVTVNGTTVFEGAMQATPAVEAFNRPERYYHLSDPGTGEVRWVDASFNVTLWETDGTVDYTEDGPWAGAVGDRTYDATVDHHATVGEVKVASGSGRLGPAPEGGGPKRAAYLNLGSPSNS